MAGPCGRVLASPEPRTPSYPGRPGAPASPLSIDLHHRAGQGFSHPVPHHLMPGCRAQQREMLLAQQWPCALLLEPPGGASKHMLPVWSCAGQEKPLSMPRPTEGCLLLSGCLAASEISAQAHNPTAVCAYRAWVSPQCSPGWPALRWTRRRPRWRSPRRGGAAQKAPEAARGLRICEQSCEWRAMAQSGKPTRWEKQHPALSVGGF